ncbi:MAG: LPS export ABC transporter periplasmic protein LptC [Armatimonadota bacterium]
MRVLGAVTATLCAIAGTVWMLVSVNPPDTRQVGPASMEPPLVRMKEAGVVLKAGGERVWEMQADKVELARDRRTASVIGLKKGTLWRGKDAVVTLSAPRATYDMVSHALRITGGVTINGPRGATIRTDSVYWVEQTRTLVCPGPVEVRTPQGVMVGTRLEGDLDLRRFTIHGLHMLVKAQRTQR